MLGPAGESQVSEISCSQEAHGLAGETKLCSQAKNK